MCLSFLSNFHGHSQLIILISRPLKKEPIIPLCNAQFSVNCMASLCTLDDDLIGNMQVDNSRKHSSFPIPASVLVRVRELAEMQAQVPPNLSVGKVAGHSGRSVHETRSGYL